MAERSVPNLAAVEALDQTEILEGYRDGLDDPEFEPGPNRSLAYWHGWRNGASDRGKRAIDSEQRTIVREYCQRAREAKGT